MNGHLLTISALALAVALFFMPEISFRRWNKRREIQEALDRIAIEDELRSGYRASVTIVCDNEYPTGKNDQCGVEVCGEWTYWETCTYYGETVLDALKAALRAKGEATQIGRTVRL